MELKITSGGSKLVRRDGSDGRDGRDGRNSKDGMKCVLVEFQQDDIFADNVSYFAVNLHIFESKCYLINIFAFMRSLDFLQD